MKKKLCIIQMFFVLFLLIFIKISAEASGTKEIVRVAAWERGGRFEKQSDGSILGYDAELIERLGKQCDFFVEYVWVSGPAEALEAIDEGRADLVTTMVRTSEREAAYLYSANSTGITYSGMISLETRTDIVYEDTEKIASCKIGYEGNSGRAASVTAYLNNRYGVTEEIPYDSIEELRKALDEGDIDLMVTGANNVEQNEKIVDLFDPQEVYYLTGKSGYALMNRLDEAFAYLNMNMPKYLTNLQDKYFPMYKNTIYTKAEEDYIHSAGTITVGVPSDREPVSYYDEKAGKFRGIIIELLDRIAEHAGLTFQYTAMKKEESIVEALKNPAYDLVAPTVEGANYEESVPIYVSEQILDTTITSAALETQRAQSRDEVRAGVAREVQNLGKKLTEKYDGISLQIFDNQEEVLEALKQGKIDLAVNNLYVWTYLLQKPSYEEIFIQPGYSAETSFCIAGEKKRTDRNLITVINKANRRITDGEREELAVVYTTGEIYQYTFMDYLYKYRILWSVLVLAAAAVVFFTMQRNHYYRKVQANNTELKKANKAKNDFLSHMSHEIRTPMNAILGMAELGKETADSEEKTLETLEKIGTAGNYLMGILNDILDMNRIESDKLTLHKRYVNSEEFLNEIVTMIKPAAEKKQIEMVTDFKEAFPIMVKMDKLRAKQVYVNLLSNSIKFSKPGGRIEWTVRDQRIDDTHMKATFTIRDYGCGMSEEFQKIMYEPFTQEHNQYSDTEPGTGLGLSIVKNLVEHMGGEISVWSRLGEGTVFTVTVIREVMDVPEKRESGTAEEQQKHTGTTFELPGACILIVEDHPMNMEITKRILKRWKIVTEEAENGQIAVEKTSASEEFHYDAILMDIRMPVMDGLQATREIRKLDRQDAGKIPIIAMTANVVETDREMALEAGMNDYLAKPVDVAKLQKVLKRCIQKG